MMIFVGAVAFVIGVFFGIGMAALLVAGRENWEDEG